MSTISQETLKCMDVWGGNRSTNSTIALPGLNLWIYSKPIGSAEQGGDVYLVSSCASGNITRLMMADVSGHGQVVSPVANRLHQLMKKNINHIDQTQFVESVNNEFVRDSESSGFATAIVSTFFSPQKKLTLHNAGHPYPFICRAGTDEWVPYFIEQEDGKTENIPLGLYEEMRFSPMQFTLEEGDKALIYTDALSEARDEEGHLLQMSGLRKQLNSLGELPAEEIIPSLLNRIEPMSEGNLQSDDLSLMLLEGTKSSVGLFNHLMAPFRVLGEMTGLRSSSPKPLSTSI